MYAHDETGVGEKCCVQKCFLVSMKTTFSRSNGLINDYRMPQYITKTKAMQNVMQKDIKIFLAIIVLKNTNLLGHPVCCVTDKSTMIPLLIYQS